MQRAIREPLPWTRRSSSSVLELADRMRDRAVPRLRPVQASRMSWLRTTRERRVVQYLAAVLLAALATWPALAFADVFGRQTFALFMSAVLIAAWNGGLGPGLLAALLSAASMNYFFEEPAYTLSIATTADGMDLMVFLFAALLTSSLSGNQRAARRRAEQANNQRDALVQSITHDLKTPLTAIRAWAQLSRRQARVLDAPKVGRIDQNLATIETTCQRMSAMLDEMLDAQRLAAGHPLMLQLSTTDLVRLCVNKAAEYELIEPARPLRVRSRGPELTGCWDSHRLERVLDNLLSNALKYGEPGSTIDVELTTEGVARPVWAVIRVRDRGQGIPAEDLPRVFDRFYRGAHTAGRAPGAGLGLAGVRGIVELHGGSVAAQSLPGEGSTFTVRLPL
jgi:signal transduction histidine kinase